MDKRFLLPAPKFKEETMKALDSYTKLRNPHFSTPSGMLLPRDKQPPPMFGPRGPTVPPWLQNQGSSRGYHTPRHRKPPRGPHGPGNGLDRDVIPELLMVNWSFWCEGCDVNCKSEEDLHQHRAAHQTCKVDGCKYVGHPAVMKRHWYLAHDEKRLLEKAQTESKQTPEEISKWREERRKRYPTKANVIQRQQAQEERFKRGERIEEDKRRFPNRPQHGEKGNGNQFKRDEQSRGRGNRRSRGKQHNKIGETKLDDLEEDGRIMFKGSSNLPEYKPKEINALSLLNGYGSDSDAAASDEELNSNDPSQGAKDEPERLDTIIAQVEDGEIIENSTGNPESLHISDDEVLPEEESSEILPVEEGAGNTSKSEQTMDSKPKRRHRTRKHKNRGTDPNQAEKAEVPAKVVKVDKPLLDYRKLRGNRQNTMLEKLLEPDIRHERNVLLQCVRFVVENKFFGIGQPKQALTENETK